MDDINTKQSFELAGNEIEELKIVLEGGRDFYGRTVLYSL